MLKITGLEKLDDLSKNLNKLATTRSVPLGDLLSPEFLAKHSTSQSLEELFNAGRFNVDTKEDLEAIPDEAMDAHVRATTSFSDWKSMIQEAGAVWAVRNLGL